jgi:predicted PurR-regulated permease PerM
MPSDSTSRTLLALCATAAGAFLLHAGESVLAPIAFALFVIALVWPVQAGVQRVLGPAGGLLAAMLASLLVVAAFVLGVAWAFGGVANWVIANAGSLQTLYAQKLAWFEARGLGEIAALGNQFDLRWLTGLARTVTVQLQGLLSFAVVALVFIILGLLEVEVVGRHLAARGGGGAGGVLEGVRDAARKLRLYMLVRTAMSLVTGFLVFAFAHMVGLELALEWGVIAFVLNYIPFLGSLIATIFPTAFAALQTGDWQFALLVFVALQAIQFVVGSVIEPRVAGKSLALSPFMTLVAVFLGALLWGVLGAFLGVQAMIVALALCERFEGSRFAAALLSGQPPRDDPQKVPSTVPSTITTANASSEPGISTMNRSP